MKVFDELIQNRDRTRANIMWTADERMWMVDHTVPSGSGRSSADERAEPDRAPMLEKLRGRDRRTLAAAMERH